VTAEAFATPGAYLQRWFSRIAEPPLPIPPREPVGIPDVLEYLKASNYVVYRAPRGEGEPKFVCQGSLVTFEHLLALANEHRAARQLPPFPLVPLSTTPSAEPL